MSFNNIVYNAEGTAAEILILPETIRLVKKLSHRYSKIGEKVAVHVVLTNNSKQDIFNVSLMIHSEPLYDFEYSNVEESWKCIRKGEERVVESYITPKRQGKFVINAAKATFLNDQHKVFTITSNEPWLDVLAESCVC